ncbi:hypothetical protein [Streptomyces sp. NPDC002851]
MVRTSKRIGTAVLAAAALVGAAGCQSGENDKSDKAGDKAGRKIQSRAAATEVLTAAYKKTAEAKSAKVSMTMSVPGQGGDMKISGVMGWDPMVMDVTMDSSALAAGQGGQGGPEKMRMIWQDNVMYMDMGEKNAQNMDGKRWMKLDLAAVAKASGDEKAMEKMTQGLENMNQDPAQQLALLLESPSLKHVGAEKVDGVMADHYKGMLTVEEMLKANKASDLLTEKERKEFLASVEKAGIKGYETEFWVNKDSYPVRMDVGIDSPEGKVDLSARYSDYGAAVDVQEPPAKDTMDLFKMLEEIGKSGAGAGADAGALGADPAL